MSTIFKIFIFYVEKKSMKKIVFLIRRDKEYYLNSKLSVLELKFKFFEGLKDKISAWNFFFGMRYTDFKKRLADIAFSTVIKNKMDALYSWSDWEVISDLKDDTWIVPIDEDDWVVPDLADVLRKEEDHKMYYWKNLKIDQEGNSFIEKIDIDRHKKFSKFNCIASCAYSLQLPQKTTLIHAHDLADEAMGKDAHQIDKTLSVNIKNISSLSYMVLHVKSIEDLLVHTREKHLVKMTENLESFSSEVDQYNDLLKELYDSCKI